MKKQTHIKVSAVRLPDKNSWYQEHDKGVQSVQCALEHCQTTCQRFAKAFV